MNDKRDVFISYHTNTAKEIVAEIGTKLESKGVSCWYAPRDCEGNFDEAIMVALNKASIFLLIINKGSMQSEHVKNEIHAAFNRYREKSMELIIFQTDDYPVNDTVQYFLGRFHRINGKEPPIGEKIDDLCERVIYAKSNFVLNNFTASDAERRIVSSAITPVSYFVGRKREQAELLDFLKTNKKIFVSGMGGIGKSQTVRKFAVNFRNEFRSVSWATYGSDLKDLLVSDANVRISGFSKGVNEDVNVYYKRKYEFLRENAVEDDLLIVDDYNVQNDPYFEEIVALPMSIIFTTRIARSVNNYAIDCIDNDDELFELFTKGYPRELDGQNKKTVMEMIRLLSGHTLSIRLISTMMKDKRIRPADMLEHLKLSTVQVLDSIDDGQEKAKHVITDMFNLAGLSEEEKRVLYNLAFVPVSGVEAMDFYDMCKLKSYDEIDSLISKNWILHNNATDYISLHPIVQDLCLTKMPFQDDVSGDFVRSLAAMYFPSSRFGTFDRNVWLLYVTERLLKFMPRSSALYAEWLPETAKVFQHFSRHDRVIGVFGEYLASGSISPKQRYGAHIEICTAYRCKEDREGLYKHMTEAERILRGDGFTESERLERTSWLSPLFGWYYWMDAEYDKALGYFMKKVDIDTNHFPDNYSELAWAHYNVGLDLAHLDRFDESFDYLNKSIEFCEKCSFAFAKACCINAMAFACIRMKKYSEAINYAHSALELFAGSVGETQRDAAQSYRMLSTANAKLGNRAEADKYAKKTYEILNILELDKTIPRWESIGI